MKAERLHRITLPLLMLLAAAVAGCASTESIKHKSAAAGTAVTYQAPLEKVVDAARSAIDAENLKLHDDYANGPTEHVLIAEEKAHGWTWGSIVRVTLTAIDPERTTVRVAADRKLATNFAAKVDYGEEIHTRIRNALSPQAGPTTARSG